jgi:hypothetical protein
LPFGKFTLLPPISVEFICVHVVDALATQFPVESSENPSTHVFAEHVNGKLNTYDATFDDFPSLLLHWFHLYPTTPKKITSTIMRTTTITTPAPIYHSSRS